MSPFMSGQQDDEGLVNVNQLNFSWRWSQNTNRMLCHSSLGNAITSVDVSFYQSPELLINYITPSSIYPIPTVQTLPYSKLQQYIKPVSAFATATTQTLVSDSIKLSMIPHKMYLFIRHARSQSNYTLPDSFAKISRVSVLWNNQSGLLSTASPQDLYSITNRCGSNLSWPQYSKYRGSVFCVEFGEDLGLEANEAAGVAGQYTIQVQADVTNLSETGDYEFMQVFDMPGTISVFENGSRASIGNFSQAMVLAAHQGNVEMSHELYQSLHGGSFASFMSGFKNFVKNVASGVGSVAKIAAPIVGALAPEFSPILGTVGSVAQGVSRAAGGSRTTGGRLSRRR